MGVGLSSMPTGSPRRRTTRAASEWYGGWSALVLLLFAFVFRPARAKEAPTRA